MTDESSSDERVRQDEAEEFGLEHFVEVPDDDTLSLEELSHAYARLMEQGEDPYSEPEPHDAPPEDETDTDAPLFDVTPRSIVEAILFVGHPQNEPTTAEQLARLMRGVHAAEIEPLVEELNELYAREERPYRIVEAGAGFRMALCEEWAPLSRSFHGRAREARLSQAAVDLLAIVAYNQGMTREEIEQLRERSSGAILSQLVRRQLLRVEQDPANRRRKRYFTTERFLELLGLTSLDDLPLPAD